MKKPVHDLIFFSVLMGLAFLTPLFSIEYINGIPKQAIFAVLGISGFLLVWSFYFQRYECVFPSFTTFLPGLIGFFSISHYALIGIVYCIIAWVLLFVPLGLLYSKKQRIFPAHFFIIQGVLLIITFFATAWEIGWVA